MYSTKGKVENSEIFQTKNIWDIQFQNLENVELSG